MFSVTTVREMNFGIMRQKIEFSQKNNKTGNYLNTYRSRF